MRFLIPEGGISGLDQPDGPFWDPAADRGVVRFDCEGVRLRFTEPEADPPAACIINDPAFAVALAASFREIAKKRKDRPHGPHRAPRNPEEGCAPRLRRREPIIGGGAGTGLSAKCEEAGGIDLIVIYNSGRYRMAGRGSLAGLMAYGNANDIVVDMAREVLPVVQRPHRCSPASTATDPFMIKRQRS